MSEHLPPQVVRIAGLRHHLESCFLEQSRDPFAKEDVVLTDYDSHDLLHTGTVPPEAPPSPAAAVNLGSLCPWREGGDLVPVLVFPPVVGAEEPHLERDCVGPVQLH